MENIPNNMRDKTLHVPVGHRCNNNCIFCMEQRIKPEKTLEELEEYIKKSSKDNFTRIVFTQKEPTLTYKKLIALAKLSKKIGFEDIMLITNGRLISNENLAKNLVLAGINHFEISLHGSDKKTHEFMTRTPNSYEQTIKGIENIQSLSKKFRLFYTINFTVTSLNYKNICEFQDFALQFEPSRIIFNNFITKDEAAKKWKLLTPRYSDILDEIRKIRTKKFILIDFPYCIFGPEFNENLGTIENYHLMKQKKPENDDATEKYIKDDWINTKAELEKCKDCKLFMQCTKPTKEYILKYGDAELLPK